MDISEYEKQIQERSALLRNKERLRSQVDQELTSVALAATQAELKDQPLITLLETLRLKRQALKASLEGAVSASPDLVSNEKLEALRTEYHTIQEQLNKAEEQHATAIKETEGLRDRLKHLREQKSDLASEIDGLHLTLLSLVITKPVAVEGSGECLMHEDVTAKACKEMALLRAKQAAVEKGSATLIHSLTEVQLNDLKKDEIRSETSVKIRQVEVVQPPTFEPAGEFGKYVARIRAVVQNFAQLQVPHGSLSLPKPATISPPSVLTSQRDKPDLSWLLTLLQQNLAEALRAPNANRPTDVGGRVILRVTVRESGALGSVIEQSSGHALLDEEAMNLVKRVSPLMLSHPLERPQAFFVPIVYHPTPREVPNQMTMGSHNENPPSLHGRSSVPSEAEAEPIASRQARTFLQRRN